MAPALRLLGVYRVNTYREARNGTHAETPQPH
jgi:hypothetical protein